MTKILLWIALSVPFFYRCAPKVLPVESSSKDSSRTVINTAYVERLRIDTVFVQIPAQNEERQTRDSASHLENDYAQSDAVVLPDGSLRHTLFAKPQSIPLPVRVKDTHRQEVRDSLVVTQQVKSVPYPVPAELSIGQKVWIAIGKFFGWISVVVLLAAVWWWVRKIRA